jgi:hypothetical protein
MTGLAGLAQALDVGCTIAQLFYNRGRYRPAALLHAKNDKQMLRP